MSHSVLSPIIQWYTKSCTLYIQLFPLRHTLTTNFLTWTHYRGGGYFSQQVVCLGVEKDTVELTVGLQVVF